MKWWLALLVAVPLTVLAQSTTKTIPFGGGFGGSIVTVNGSSEVIISDPNFVGVVSDCVGGAVANGAYCDAKATVFDGKTAPTGAYFTLKGQYVAATPATRAGGFVVLGSMFGMSRDTSNLPTCNAGNGCGDELTQLYADQQALAVLHNGQQTGIASGLPVQFMPGRYRLGFQNWVTALGGGTVGDACLGPVSFYNDQNDAADVSLGTGTVTIGTDPNKLVLAVQACGGGSGHTKCIDKVGDVVRQGNELNFVGAGTSSWRQSGGGLGEQRAVVGISDDGLNVFFTPPLTHDYSGAVRVSDNKMWLIDNADATSEFGPKEFRSALAFNCGENVTFTETGLAQPAIAYIGSPKTIAGGYRQIPVNPVVAYFSWATLNVGVDDTFYGPGDHKVVTGTSNLNTQSYTNLKVNGQIQGNPDWNYQKLAVTGEDPNSATDDAPTADIMCVGAGCDLSTSSLDSNSARFVLCNCSVLKVDASYVEDPMQFLYVGRWTQAIEMHGSSQEIYPRCGSQWPSNSACLPAGQIPPLVALRYDIGSSAGSDAFGVFAGFVWKWSVMFVNADMPPPAVVNVKGSNPIHVVLEGAVANGDHFVDVSGASGKTVFAGHVQLKNMLDVSAPGVADFSDLVLQNESGSAIAW